VGSVVKHTAIPKQQAGDGYKPDGLLLQPVQNLKTIADIRLRRSENKANRLTAEKLVWGRFYGETGADQF
jgi:hypothetical protein